MAQLIVNIPDAQVPRVQDAYCGTYDYDANKQAGETKLQFAKRAHAQHTKELVTRWESSRAADQARADAEAAAESEVTITEG